MGLFLLFVMTLLFFGINYVITKGDFLSPSTLFCEMFFLYELVCIIGQSYYEITIHFETVFVIVLGMLAFTFFELVSHGRKLARNTSSVNYDMKPQYIEIPQRFVIGLIILQLGTIFFFIRYLRAISAAWGGGSSIDEMISLYDTMTKFWTTTFRNLNIAVPMFYRIFNPISSAGAYIVLYVAVNNFVACRKVKWSQIVVIGLLCVMILLNGSRSPLLRIITIVIILEYIFYYRTRHRKNKGLKTFAKLIGVMAAVAVLMFVTLIIMGRAQKGIGDILHYLFVYLGAPIVNLDSFIANSDISFWHGLSSMFGEHTFQNLYSYIGKLFGIQAFTSIQGIGKFTYSANGLEIGNVYTTFYPFVYDFGYVGVLPLISVVAAFYCFTYRKVLRKKGNGKIDFRLFIYGYLFNDLVMLTFSNRFYSTIFDAPFIKHFILSWLLVQIFVEHSLCFGRYRVKIGSLRGI